MKTLNFKPYQFFIILFVLTSIASCKKAEQPVPQQESIGLANESSTLDLAAPSGLYVGTAYRTPTIGSITSLASASNGTMYVANYSEDKIFKIRTDSVVTVLAQNINSPAGIKVAKNGNVYAALFFDNKIIKITPSGVVDTLKLNLTLNHPTSVAIADDLTLYIADGFHHRIVKVDPAGVATVLAGKLGSTGNYLDGTGSAARFCYPTSIKLGADGNLWVVDGDTKGGSGLTLRRVTTQGVVTTFLDATGIAGARIYDIQPAKLDANFNPTSYGNVFVLHYDNRITQFNTQNKTEIAITKSKVSGYVDGPIETAQLDGSFTLSFHNNVLFVSNGSVGVIRKIYKK